MNESARSIIIFFIFLLTSRLKPHVLHPMDISSVVISHDNHTRIQAAFEGREIYHL